MKILKLQRGALTILDALLVELPWAEVAAMVAVEVVSSTMGVTDPIPSQHMSTLGSYRRPRLGEAAHLRLGASLTGIPLRLQDTADHLLVLTDIIMDRRHQFLVVHTTAGQQMAIITKAIVINTLTGLMEATMGLPDSVNHMGLKRGAVELGLSGRSLMSLMNISNLYNIFVFQALLLPVHCKRHCKRRRSFVTLRIKGHQLG